MSFIYSEQKVNTAGFPITTQADGSLPAISGANLFSLPQQVTATASNFDTYKVVNVSSNITAAEETMYLVEGNCTINMPAPTAFGKKIAFLMVNDTATLTLVCNVGSGGTGLRMCIGGLQYGNSLANLNTAMGYGGSTTYTLTGIGKGLEFVAFTGSGVYGYSSWIERSNRPMQNLTSTGVAGTGSIPVGWSEGSVINMSAPLTATEFILTPGGVLPLAARYIGNPITLQSTTSATQGASLSYTIGYTSSARGNLPQRWVMGTLGLSGTQFVARTAKMSINLSNVSNSSNYAEQPILIRFDGRSETFAAGDLYTAGIAYEFTDTTAGVTFQQIRIDASTTVNALNTFDYFRAPTGVNVASRVTGIEIWYNKALKRWFLIRQILKGDV